MPGPVDCEIVDLAPRTSDHVEQPAVSSVGEEDLSVVVAGGDDAAIRTECDALDYVAAAN